MLEGKTFENEMKYKKNINSLFFTSSFYTLTKLSSIQTQTHIQTIDINQRNPINNMKVSTMKTIDQRIPRKKKFANSSRNRFLQKLKHVIIGAMMEAKSSRNRFLQKLKHVIISAMMETKLKVKVEAVTADILQPVLYSDDMTTTDIMPNHNSKVADASVSKNTITTYLEQEQTTDAFTPRTIEKSRQRSISNSVQRVKDRNYYWIDLNTLKGCVTSEREKNYIEKYFSLSPIDNRFVVNWLRFAADVLLDEKVTQEDRKWARIILRAYKEGCDDIDIYAEWHHLVPLCMRGSVHDPFNYVRLQPGLHLLVHAALCYFFPSYIGLQFSLNVMLNGIKRMKRKLSEKLSGKELTDFLQDAVRNEKVFATARIEAAKAKSKSMMGNQYRKNSKKSPSTDPVVNGSREKDDNDVVNVVDVDMSPSVVEVKKKSTDPAINGKRKLPSTNSKFNRQIQYAQRKRKPPSTDPEVNRQRERSNRTNERNRLIAQRLPIPWHLQLQK